MRIVSALLALVLGLAAAWLLLRVEPAGSSTHGLPAASAPAAPGGSGSESASQALRTDPDAWLDAPLRDRHLPGRPLEAVELLVRVLPPAGRELATPVEVELRSLAVDPLQAATPPVEFRVVARPVGAGNPAFEAVFPELPPRDYRVLASSPGLDSVFTLMSLDARSPRTRIDLTLAPLCSLEGILFQAEDRRLRAASVPVALERVEADLRGQRPRYETRADGEGVYRFPEIPPGIYRLVVGAPEHPLVTPLHVEVVAAGSQQDVGGLPEVGEVAFTAYDELGGTLAGVTISIAPENPDDAGGGHGTTDEAGTFRLGGLPPGSYLVVAQREGFLLLRTRYEHQSVGLVPQVQPLVLRTP